MEHPDNSRVARPTGMTAALILTGFVAAAGCLTGCDRQSSPEPESSPPVAAPVVPLTNMVPIQAGSFIRGKQLVTLANDFWLGRFEVTQGEYAALMGNNPSHFVGDDLRPVEKVSHADATAFCAALTRREQAAGRLPDGWVYRLPTEAEWEYACRAGSTNRFSFGDDDEQAEAHAWTEENSERSPHPVGLKLPNAWGLYDMHGNVWEWCQDWFAEYPSGDLMDPTGPGAGEFKVFRGGSWNHAAKFARCANRFVMAPANGIYFVGFRLALGPALPPPR